ncbi:unnamed protein product, partial [Amoebophrya sp. A120]|eukprot:GSA120T00010322001.1
MPVNGGGRSSCASRVSSTAGGSGSMQGTRTGEQTGELELHSQRTYKETYIGQFLGALSRSQSLGSPETTGVKLVRTTSSTSNRFLSVSSSGRPSRTSSLLTKNSQNHHCAVLGAETSKANGSKSKTSGEAVQNYANSTALVLKDYAEKEK